MNSKEDRIIEHSFDKNTKRYRIRRKNEGTISSIENTDIDLYNRQYTSSNQEKFEFYPFKHYWYYLLRFKYRKYVKPIIKLDKQSKRHMTIVVLMIITVLVMFYLAYKQGIF
ncbi:hypothetical protein [Lutibacter sp.]